MPLQQGFSIMLIHMKTVEPLGGAPIPDTMNIAMAFMDKRPFIHSTAREKRTLKCDSEQEYPHPEGTHCCMKCHPGTHIKQHCAGEGMAPNCTKCPELTYMTKENFAQKCRGCNRCRTNLGQKVISNCTSKQDTVCGCEEYQYQTSNSSEFYCENCSACHNGTVKLKCTTFHDSLCECNYGYFLQTDKNLCVPCSSCKTRECKSRCEPETVVRPENPSGLMPLLCTLVVLFGAGFVFLLARKFLKRSCKEKLNTICSSPSVPFSSPSPRGESVPEAAIEDNADVLKPDHQKRLLEIAATTSKLPDCVPSAGGMQILDCPVALYKIVDRVPFLRWKEFIRRLGLLDNTVQRIETEQRSMREAQYEMLKQWRQQSGPGATVECISNVLTQMELSGCSEAIQEDLLKL
ncbi:tumor necrosis factor receptor superfamily member 1A-like isoform X2 [Hemicordylus capensis]|uniref:tumor necrosis factor receptor superfamily member 1A-like isoform X2 n=1 Tax=Hemicordylus capensis TaxID=884348 RepID=UPI002303B5C3|nr:tumor necrosis factor receptor superfamily member 1A-like isoform X2 [Hemicordylus capensis]